MSDNVIKDILSILTDMELIELHSYVRSHHMDKMVYINDIIEIDKSFDLNVSLNFEMDGSKLMLFTELELSERNLN